MVAQDSHTCPICNGPRLMDPRIVVHEERVYWKGALVIRVRHEANLFDILYRRLNSIVRRETWWELTYGHLPEADQPESPEVYDVYICHVRHLLTVAQVPLEIETYVGQGYLMKWKKDVHRPS